MNAVRTAAGFTLIEMLLCVAIISLLVGMASPVYISFVERNDLSIATQTIAAMLTRAQTYARAANFDDAWSVDVQSTTVTLFEGITFATRNTTRDEAYSIPGSVTPGFTGDIVFARFTGVPTSTPTVTLTGLTGDTRTITLNAKGVVDY
ncbi:MAG TPA: prepilin-type N-terminal cleavage/methylation domain-containing protein [Candidatus Saccharimonadales bacterium]|nr:prepilin-type N-terminal cleavage/methylation domain-containing protein [Candidatus Saccharimonadales bacterium]